MTYIIQFGCSIAGNSQTSKFVLAFQRMDTATTPVSHLSRKRESFKVCFSNWQLLLCQDQIFQDTFHYRRKKNKKMNWRSIVKRDVIYIHASWYRHQENAASAPQAKIQKFQLPTHNPNFLSQMAKNVLRQKGHTFTNLQQKYNMKDVRPISFK